MLRKIAGLLLVGGVLALAATLMSGNSILAWQSKQKAAINCSYIGKRGKFDVPFAYQDQSSYGASRCPIIFYGYSVQ